MVPRNKQFSINTNDKEMSSPLGKSQPRRLIAADRTRTFRILQTGHLHVPLAFCTLQPFNGNVLSVWCGPRAVPRGAGQRRSGPPGKQVAPSWCSDKGLCSAVRMELQGDLPGTAWLPWGWPTTCAGAKGASRTPVLVSLWRSCYRREALWPSLRHSNTLCKKI